MAKEIIKNAVLLLLAERTCKCPGAMQYATLTDPASIPESARENLSIIIGKYL